VSDENREEKTLGSNCRRPHGLFPSSPTGAHPASVRYAWRPSKLMTRAFIPARASTRSCAMWCCVLRGLVVLLQICWQHGPRPHTERSLSLSLSDFSFAPSWTLTYFFALFFFDCSLCRARGRLCC
jgi:hypothetical protein